MPHRGLTEMALLCQLRSGGVGQLPAGCHTAPMHWFTRGLLTRFLVGPLLAALIAISGCWPVSATPDPPSMET